MPPSSSLTHFISPSGDLHERRPVRDIWVSSKTKKVPFCWGRTKTIWRVRLCFVDGEDNQWDDRWHWEWLYATEKEASNARDRLIAQLCPEALPEEKPTLMQAIDEVKGRIHLKVEDKPDSFLPRTPLFGGSPVEVRIDGEAYILSPNPLSVEDGPPLRPFRYSDPPKGEAQAGHQY